MNQIVVTVFFRKIIWFACFSLLSVLQLATPAHSEIAKAAGWISDQAANEPVSIIVSLPEQRLTVYRGGMALVTSPVSTGKKGYATPSGVFSILSKNRHHKSNIYSNAPMPFMQRLTWSGIALHSSNSVPNYPASHGCVRLPDAFAGELFRFTSRGAHVIIANETVQPFSIDHNNLPQPSRPAPKDYDQVAAEASAIRYGSKPEKTKRSNLPLRILLTRRIGRERIKDVQKLLNELSFDAGEVDGYLGPDTAKAIIRFQKSHGLNADGLVSDGLTRMLHQAAGKSAPMNGHLYVRQKFNPVFDVPVMISGDDRPLGTHLFTAQDFNPDMTRARWLAVSLTKGSSVNLLAKGSTNKKKPSESIIEIVEKPALTTANEALDRIVIPDDVRRRISEKLTPGTSLAITDDGISRETTPNGSDFVLLMQ